MLVECPRCHFKQPQDQYCASCGVDMLTYKRKEAPLIQKIIKSGLFQFIMVLLLGFTATYFVLQNDRPQKWVQKTNRFSSAHFNSLSRTKTEAGVAEDNPDFEAPPPSTEQRTEQSTSVDNNSGSFKNRITSPSTLSSASSLSTSSSTPSTTALSRTTSTTASATTTASTNSSIALTTIKNYLVRTRMVEIDHAYLDALINDNNGDISSVADDIKFFKAFPGIELEANYMKVLKTDLLDFVNTKTNTVRAANNLHGIGLAITYIGESNNTVRLEVNYIKKHPSDQLSIPLKIDLSAHGFYILSGQALISYLELENNLSQIAPFTIFKSVEYRNQKTTFAIIFDLQKLPP